MKLLIATLIVLSLSGCTTINITATDGCLVSAVATKTVNVSDPQANVGIPLL